MCGSVGESRLVRRASSPSDEQVVASFPSTPVVSNDEDVGAVWLVASTELRRRLRSTVALVLVAGLAAGFAITTAVGARRAWTAWDRFRDATLAPTGTFSTGNQLDGESRARVSRMPGVEAIGNFSYVPVAPAPLVPGEDAGAFVALDRSFGSTIYRPLVVAGRHADPRRADEITINEELAAKGLKVGQRVRLQAGFAPDTKPLGRATIVGIVRGQFDLGIFSGNAATYLTYAVLAAHRDALEDQLQSQDGAMLRLRGGEAGRVRFEKSLQRDFGPLSFAPRGDSLGQPVRQVLDVQKVAWLLLAMAASLAVLLAVRQALARVVGGISATAPTLRALGLRRPQLAAVGVVQAAILGVAITVIGVAIGILASGLVPSGLAHRADPDPGIRVEPLVLAVAAFMLLAVLLSAGAFGGWRAWDDAGRRPRASRVPRRGPLSLVLGTEWALGSSPGPARGSARSALIAVATALAGVVGLVTFAASNDELHDTPRLHGWGFDAVMTGEADADFGASYPRLAADPDVTGLAWGTLSYAVVEGEPLEVFVLEQAKGGVVHPTLLEGRAPAGPGEIALGSGTLRRFGKGVGDTVSVAGKAGPQRLRVVGRAAYPEVGNNGDVLHAGSLTRSALARVESLPANALALVRVRDGRDVEQVIARGAGTGAFEVSRAYEPRNVNNLRVVGAIPWALAAFLAALGLVAVGHALAMSVRARRGDIAMLRTLGLVRGQVRQAVAAQATATVVAGAVVGVPIGIALGRVSWSAIASGLGVVERPIVPAAIVAAAALAALVVANLMAAAPAVIAGRLRPAAILRTE